MAIPIPRLILFTDRFGLDKQHTGGSLSLVDTAMLRFPLDELTRIEMKQINSSSYTGAC